MSTRREKRLEGKKRKAEAFLSLVKKEAETGFSKGLQNEDKEKKTKTDRTGISLSAEEMIAAYKEELRERRTSTMAGTSEAVKNGIKEKKTKTDSAGVSLSTAEMMAAYKQELRERHKQTRLQQKPKLFLTLDELTRHHPPSNGTAQVKQLPPLFIADVQHLLLYALQVQRTVADPRWCRLQRAGKVDKVVVVVLDSLSAEEFRHHGDSLPTLKSAFDVSAEMVAPVQYGSSVREDLLTVPLSMTQMTKLNISKKPAMKPKAAKPLPQHGPAEVVSTHEQDKFDRTCLLLDPQQMMYEGFPLPQSQNSVNNETSDFVYSKEKYEQVSSTSPIFSVDCEMVVTTERRNELARISVVNENLEVVYDTLVKPENKIIDYVTQFSGVTRELLDPVTTRLKDVQNQLSQILPSDAILCGQSLNGDLYSLKMFHPYVIDTSVIYNLSGKRRLKTGLRRLTEYFLKREIQGSSEGHCSVEDAVATMELVLLKLRTGLTFGDLVLAGPKAPDVNGQNNETKSTDCQNCIAQQNQPGCSENSSQEEQTSSENGSKSENCQTCDCDEMSAKFENRTEMDFRNNVWFNQDEVKRCRMFFHREGNRYVRSFFQMIKNHKKTGKITDSEQNASLYLDRDLVQTSISDKKRQLLVNSSLQDADFQMVHLYGFSNCLPDGTEEEMQDEETKKKCLWKLDRRVWKILKAVPANSLVVVILSGRLEDQSIKPAMTLAKIT